MLKFNYIYYRDEKTNKNFIVTIGYNDKEYSFTIKSLNDRHFKRHAKEIIIDRFNQGHTLKFGCLIDWHFVENHFNMIRQNNRYWNFGEGVGSTTFRFPSRLNTAVLNKRGK